MGAIGFGTRLSVARAGAAGVAAAFDFATGVLPSGATLTRASSGRRVSDARLLVSEPVDVARFDHDPVSGALLGLLIEPQRTNLLLASADFAAAPWSVTRAAIGADAAIAPDGAAAADLLRGTAASGFVRQGGMSGINPGNELAFSVFVKSTAPADPLVSVIFGAGASVRALAAPAGPAGFRRVVAKVTATAASGLVQIGLDAAGDEALLWGAQLEIGSEATSPVATASGGHATRAADVLTLDWGSRGVGDGAIGVRVTFDDASTQELAMTVANGRATLPGTLARTRVRLIERI